jgi:hypothetical protein
MGSILITDQEERIEAYRRRFEHLLDMFLDGRIELEVPNDGELAYFNMPTGLSMIV